MVTCVYLLQLHSPDQIPISTGPSPEPAWLIQVSWLVLHPARQRIWRRPRPHVSTLLTKEQSQSGFVSWVYSCFDSTPLLDAPSLKESTLQHEGRKGPQRTTKGHVSASSKFTIFASWPLSSGADCRPWIRTQVPAEKAWLQRITSNELHGTEGGK